VTGWPARPVIYEIDTAVWLGDLSRAAGQLVTLADVTGSDWDAITPDGANAVWLMGVWERSPAGLALTNANQELQASFREALPDLRPEDVIGSPYCVRRYVADDMFGGRSGLAAARAAHRRHAQTLRGPSVAERAHRVRPCGPHGNRTPIQAHERGRAATPLRRRRAQI